MADIECGGDRCLGMSSKTHEEIVTKLARIEAGQEHLSIGLIELNKAIAKVQVQEERQVTMKSRIDAAWVKLDTLKEAHDKCQIQNIKTQVGWIWVFLSSLALGLTLMFVGGLVNK